MPRGQAERLAPMIAEILEEAGLAPATLAGIGVCTGPGNFTGVRIGVSAARGLALGAARPAMGVPRAEALAAAESARAGRPLRLAVTIAARRGELYAQVFEAAPGVLPRPLCELMQAPPEALADRLAALAPERVCGPGAAPLATALGADAAASGDLAPPEAVARLAALRLAALAPGETPPRPAPIYLRPADAAPPSEPSPALIADNGT